jgi:ribulose-5-phosphate 4-epimerase/fuculose-1-phosphate aldolase
MKFTVYNPGLSNNFTEEIVAACIRRGDNLTESNDGINYVLNLCELNNPKPFRRKAKSVFVITIISGNRQFEDEKELKAECYNALIKSLANLLIYISPDLTTHFTTPEAGFYDIFFNACEIYKKMEPIITSHFATENSFSTDLPFEYRNGTYITSQIKFYGKVMDELGVLPVPFPLKDFLTIEQMKHIYKIYGITGASYGNLSARENITSLGSNTFWMSGRGVDKSNLNLVGKDILLVKDFNFETGTGIISVAENYDKKARVSVDAVEHALIYKTFKNVGAIIHVHAWMDGILCTRQNYPCGTIELAEEVVSLLKRTNNPQSAVVGLKNHGLTITGESLKAIFDRVTGKLIKEVEMFA